MNSLELRQEKKKLVVDARAYVKNIEDTYKRDLTPEESANFDAMMSKVDELDKRIGQLESLEGAEADLEAAPEENSRSRFMAQPETRDQRATPEYKRAFAKFLTTGVKTRDLAVGSGGGDILAPVSLTSDIITILNNMLWVRKFASIETLKDAVSLGVRQLNPDVSDADWSAEVPSSFTGDSSLALTRRDLTPQLLAKLVLLSHQLVKQSSDIEKVVMERLVYKFGVSMEKGYMTGSGSGQPLGIFTASSSGIPTSQDLNIGAAISSDAVYQTVYGLPQQYVQDKSFAFVMSRAIAKTVRTLKDSYGRYMWEPSMIVGQPETLAGVPLYYSEYAPTAVTNGSYVWVAGCFRFYQIAELGAVEFDVLKERYADVSQIGYLGRYYGDGSPVLANAFVRAKIVTS